MAKIFRQRKGQSAIEYLTTYGWMLLVIAIVGGAIFSTVQDSSNLNTVTGFKGEDVQIVNSGMDSNGDLQLEVRSQARDVTLNEVALTNVDNGNSASNTSVSRRIEPGDTETVAVTEINNSESSNTFDIELVYDSGGIPDVSKNGTISGEFQAQ